MLILPERHIYLWLVTRPEVARLTGFNIYPIAVPKTGAQMPFIVYRRSSLNRDTQIAGLDIKPIVSMQVSIWGQTYDSVRELAYEVWNALDGRTGTLANATIQELRLMSEVDDFLDPVQTSSQLPPAYEVRQLYQLRWD
jgi:hypothetical protein